MNSRAPVVLSSCGATPRGGVPAWAGLLLLLLVLSGCGDSGPRLSPVLREALAHNRKGIEAQERGETLVASREFTEALRLNASLENEQGVVVELINLARLQRRQGQLPQAAAYVDQALAQLDERAPLFPEVAFEKALIHLEDGRVAEARPWAQRAADPGHSDQRGRRLNLLARILLLQQDPAAAEAAAGEALALNKSREDSVETANSQRLLAEAALAGRRPGPAADLYAQALALDKAEGLSLKIARDLRGLAQAAQQLGEAGEAMDYLRRAYVVSLNGNDPAGASLCLAQLLELYRAGGNKELAAAAAEELERLRAGTGRMP